ncbi:transposase [Streptomyces rimosus subsp. rimosus]|nr:hypothetical protein CTZ40_03090 [Streptomyces rimosus]QEV80535.1 hypothetical protein CP984_03070 [Streptomyces rimosus]QTL91325.1 transposase [Streptomyces rimosus subsp. rimosus]
MTTKIHLAADGRCRPLAFLVTAGQAGDAPAFEQVMARIRVPRPAGRPRTAPAVVLADKAYSSRAIRRHLKAPRHPDGDPATRRPGRQPQTARQPRRSSTGLRPRGLQTAQRRRAVHVRHEASCCIPGTAGRNWRDIPGPDGSPGSER